MNQDKKPLILLLLNGWGIAKESEINAISLAEPSNFNQLTKEYPVMSLKDDSKDIIVRYNKLARGLEDKLSISEIISQSNLKQLFISNHEFFLESFTAFSGDKLLNQQELFLINQSIEDPLKQAEEIFNKSKEYIKSRQFQFIHINLPTIYQAYQLANRKYLIKAISRVDFYIKKLYELSVLNNYSLVISSLFGQAENLNNLPSKKIFYPEISDNPTPLLVVSKDLQSTNFGFFEPIDNDLSTLPSSGGFEIIKKIILQLIKII